MRFQCKRSSLCKMKLSTFVVFMVELMHLCYCASNCSGPSSIIIPGILEKESLKILSIRRDGSQNVTFQVLRNCTDANKTVIGFGVCNGSECKPQCSMGVQRRPDNCSCKYARGNLSCEISNTLLDKQNFTKYRLKDEANKVTEILFYISFQDADITKESSWFTIFQSSQQSQHTTPGHDERKANGSGDGNTLTTVGSVTKLTGTTTWTAVAAVIFTVAVALTVVVIIILHRKKTSARSSSDVSPQEGYDSTETDDALYAQPRRDRTYERMTESSGKSNDHQEGNLSRPRPQDTVQGSPSPTHYTVDLSAPLIPNRQTSLAVEALPGSAEVDDLDEQSDPYIIMTSPSPDRCKPPAPQTRKSCSPALSDQPCLPSRPQPVACKVLPTSRTAETPKEEAEKGSRQGVDQFSIATTKTKAGSDEHTYATLRSRSQIPAADPEAGSAAEPGTVLTFPHTSTLLLTAISGDQSLDPRFSCTDDRRPGCGSLKRLTISRSPAYGIELSPDSPGVLMIKFE